MMRFAVRSNPFMSQMVQSHPEIEFILNNPEMMRAMMTPENLRMAMGMMQTMRGTPGFNPYAQFGRPPATGTEPMAPPPRPMGIFHLFKR